MPSEYHSMGKFVMKGEGKSTVGSAGGLVDGTFSRFVYSLASCCIVYWWVPQNEHVLEWIGIMLLQDLQ